MQGLDHVIFVAPVDRQLLLRMYAIKLKKSGTKVSGESFPYNCPCIKTVSLKHSLLHCVGLKRC